MHRDGSRTAATFKMERFVIIVNGFQPLTIITKRSILDVAAVLDPPLMHIFKGTLLDLGKLFATESPLKMIKNALYFILKALFVLKIFKFLS